MLNGQERGRFQAAVGPVHGTQMSSCTRAPHRREIGPNPGHCSGCAGYGRPVAETRPDRPQGMLFAAGIGALAGACLSTRRRLGAAAVGGILLAGSEAAARRLQRPGEIPPLWHRIVTSAALAGRSGGWPDGSPPGVRWRSAPAPGAWPGSWPTSAKVVLGPVFCSDPLRSPSYGAPRWCRYLAPGTGTSTTPRRMGPLAVTVVTGAAPVPSS